MDHMVKTVHKFVEPASERPRAIKQMAPVNVGATVDI